MKPSLASLGKFLIEAAMPQINVPDIMPKLILGPDLSRHFESVYCIQQKEISANVIDNVIYANPEMKAVNEMARKFRKIKDMSEKTSSHNIEIVAATLDNSASYLASNMVAQANSINSMCDIPTYERMLETTKGVNSYGIGYLDGLKLEQVMDDELGNSIIDKDDLT